MCQFNIIKRFLSACPGSNNHVPDLGHHDALFTVLSLDPQPKHLLHHGIVMPCDSFFFALGVLVAAHELKKLTSSGPP